MIYGKKSFRSRFGILLSVTILVTVFCSSSIAAQDPVMDFIIAADSIYKAGGEEALAGYVNSNVVLAGAAVHQLIDIAIIVGDQGNTADEKDNMEFAGLVARIYRDGGGDPAPLELTGVYMAWTTEQRKARAKAKILEEQAAEARGAREFEKAAGMFAQALDIYREIGDSYSEAIVYGSYGVLYWYAGDFDSVFKYYGQALEARRSIDNAILEGRTLNGLGSANFVTNRYDSAEAYYLKAIDIRKMTGDLGGLGTSLTYLGNTHYRTGRLAVARDYYEEAAGLVGSLGNKTQQIELLTSVANLYSDMGRLSRSNESYREALEIAVSSKSAQHEITIRLNIALNLASELRYREAMKELDIVSVLLETTPGPIHSVELLRNRGQIYLDTGELDHARDDFLSFLQAAKELEDPVLEMTAMVHIGYLCLELGAFDRGLVFADSTLVMAERLDDASILNNAHSLAAQLEGRRGNYPAALEHWEIALERSNVDGAETRALHNEIGIATVTALMGESEKARGFFLSLLPRIREAGLGQYETHIFMGIAHTFEESDPDSARIYYGRALTMVETIGLETGSAELGSSLLMSSRRFYYEEVARYYARMAVRSGDDQWSSDAFRTIERAKARGLLELLEGSLAGEHSEQEDAVLDEIYSLDPAFPDYRADLERLERSYRKIRDERLEAATDRLASRRQVRNLEEVIGSLPKNTVMFAYALGDSTSQLWVIDRNGHDLFSLPGRAQIAGDVDMLKAALTRPGSGDAILVAKARELYQLLIEPGEERLRKEKHLIIVPDGCLFEIPFEVLIEREVDEGAGWQEIPFLVRSRAPLYAPSASVFVELREKKQTKKYGTDILAVGDPDYSYLEGSDDRALRPLPNTRAEVKEIAGLFKEDKRILLVGAEASEASLKKTLAGHTPRLIHIAAHGLVDPVTPAASSIALSAEPGDGEDGFLHTLEILALPVESRLVVLSACETATGRVSRGEGVVGLSRAFLGAGASAVVSSLWAVPDESTARLMTACYERMKKKKRPAVRALKEAKLELLESGEYSHPFYWASFIVIGSEKAPW